jgi:lysylphosphatidylglycerol synthetase-like protein (DUF2156 family)
MRKTKSDWIAYLAVVICIVYIPLAGYFKWELNALVILVIVTFGMMFVWIRKNI